MDGHIWFVGWYDGGDYHEIKITQREVDNCATAGSGLNSILYYVCGRYGDEALYNMIFSWNGGAAKYDIRDWAPGHEKMGKGTTLTAEELENLKEMLNQLQP
ncbi:hypothetical protein ADH76_06125 [Enterocloster clostridioformis]|nr:hypothetical protein A4V08_33585 [Lachnoclostridium sp. YL32]OXE70920.1 hypothetical protein ADH76_06125 [Enterocloster clostridioformis]